MPALIVFLAGVLVALALFAVGPLIGAVAVVCFLLGMATRPFVIGLLANW